MRIKMFTDKNILELETEINEFLNNIKESNIVSDIKYTTFNDNGTIVHSVIVIYK